MGWQLELAERYDFRRWSYGLVETVDDLYDPRIWGPTCDAVCGCGKYEGREHDGMICDMCGVKVAVDSEMLRKTRCGHVRLIVPCTHPMGTADDRTDEFTVAPIAYRQDPNGMPNALGRKYEWLLEVRDAATAQMSEEEKNLGVGVTPPRCIDSTPIQAALNDIVGMSGSTATREACLAPDDTVLRELLMAVRCLDLGVSALVHAVGCKIQFEGTL